MRIFWVFFFLFVKASAWELEVGYQSAYGLVEDGFTRNTPYLEVCLERDLFPQGETLQNVQGDLRLCYDIEKEGGRIDLRELFYQCITDQTQLKIGVQQIPWGETFGFFIADIVNPRDYTDPLFNEIDWIRRGVFALNFQCFPDPFSFQLIVTPVPLNNLLPKKGDPFYIVPPLAVPLPLLPRRSFDIDNFSNDAEYGGRAGCLMDCGLDLSLFYYRHYSRDPLLELTSQNALNPLTEKIHTFGGSFSKAYDETVLRGDLVWHRKTPITWPVFGQVQRQHLVRVILGADRQFENDWCLGVQYHGDYWEEACLHAASVMVSKDFCEGRRCLALFVYKGLNNRDLWIQPKVTLYFDEGIEVSLRGDFVFGTMKRGNLRDGVVGRFRDKDRLFLWVSKTL